MLRGMQTASTTSPTPTQSFGLSTMLVTAALASAGAGLVHAAAAGTHNGDASLAWLFALIAAAQLGWAVFVMLRPTRWLTVAGVALNAAAVAAWVLSRTVGLFGPLAEVTPVGTQDLLAAVLGTAAVAAGALTIALPTRRRFHLVPAGMAGVLVLALAMPAMAASHTHGAHPIEAGEVAAGDDHLHGSAGAEAEHGHAEGTPADDPHASEPTGAIISLDDPRLTTAQQERATEVLTETREALAAFPNEASIVAAGYTSIGDGRAVGRFEHYIHPAYMSDGRELDPGAIESIVVQRQTDGSKKVMSAMFILETGSTMEDVPDVAGGLSVWHDHQNLCWDASGTRLAGVLMDGQCRPGGTFQPTAPMLHVWLEDTPCGPFAGAEGHGGTCEHPH